jgi:hypothetical protein
VSTSHVMTMVPFLRVWIFMTWILPFAGGRS